jgi:hypothetical protein
LATARRSFKQLAVGERALSPTFPLPDPDYAAKAVFYEASVPHKKFKCSVQKPGLKPSWGEAFEVDVRELMTMEIVFEVCCGSLCSASG